MKEKKALEDRKVDTKLIIMAAWICMMFLYLYCDWYSLFRTGQIAQIAAGKIGFFDVSQGSLAALSLVMIIPSLMIFFSAVAAAPLCRWVNLVVSALYAIVNIGNMAGEAWAYYFMFGILELGLSALIFVLALRWPRRQS